MSKKKIGPKKASEIASREEKRRRSLLTKIVTSQGEDYGEEKYVPGVSIKGDGYNSLTGVRT